MFAFRYGIPNRMWVLRRRVLLGEKVRGGQHTTRVHATMENQPYPGGSLMGASSNLSNSLQSGQELYRGEREGDLNNAGKEA